MKVKIEQLIYGGLGLARTDNGIIFVSDVVSGETVDADVIGKKNGVPLAVCKTVLSPSENRRIPQCSLVGTCGGCNWQHIVYNEQLKSKNHILKDCLVRIGKLETIPSIETIFSSEFFYRSRAQIKVDRNLNKLGFFKRKSNDVVSIKHCPLLVESLNDFLTESKKITTKVPQEYNQIKVIAGDNDIVASDPVIKGMTTEKTTITVSGKIFGVSGGGFFQGNKLLLDKLGTWAKKYIYGDYLVDMFGGTGFFSILLSSNFTSGLLVESDKKLVEQAKQNFKLNSLKSFKAKHMTAENFFKSNNSTNRPDCIIVDPPRPGLTRIVREGLRQINVPIILYVSCNPSTFARDIGFFVNKCGYKMEKVVMFDMYPQTHHLESAVILRKN